MIKKLARDFFLIEKGNEEYRDDWVVAQLGNIEEGGILDVGAGTQRYKKHCSHLSYVSQDFCQYDGSGNGDGLQTGEWDVSKIDIVSDITEIPLPDDSVDNIICTEVLEHVPDPVKALNEMYRILKPNGKLILTAPFGSLTHFAPYHFCTGFNSYWYHEHMKEKFQINIISANGNFFDFTALEINYMLGRDSKKYTGKTINIVEKVILGLAHRIIKQMGLKSINSEKLATTGYHVLATKIS